MKKWTFPAGERGIAVDTGLYGIKEHVVMCKFTGSDSIVDMLLETDALRRQYPEAKVSLSIPYFPYARQDRKMNEGESHSLKVMCNLINSQNYCKVRTVDPHSDVVEALVDNLEILPQYMAALRALEDDFDYDYLIAPDAGALKKIYKLAQHTETQVICAGKLREVSTGDILKSYIQESDYERLIGKKALIVDDICDGGRTFTELRAILPATATVDLYVTHGIFSKGKSALTDVFNQVFCYNDMTSN